MGNTIVLQIGNSDDKLSQQLWSAFVSDVEDLVRDYASEVHFTGFSSPAAKWQNAAWVFTADEDQIAVMKTGLVEIRKAYNQDSVAWTTGDTYFL